MQIDPGGATLRLGDGDVQLPLYSGSIQYWQLERRVWPSVLRTARQLGFRCVETYIPWAEHEVSRGKFDFSGNRDVAAFLESCSTEELYVIARPGPHINAELTNFGYPARIVEDPRMQARTAAGAPAVQLIPPKAFPIVSYCSEEFYDEVALWFDAVCPILACRQYPEGPVVMVQADNEHSCFFKLTPYDVDYSDGALAHYRAVVRERHASVEDAEPPRRFAATEAPELPRYLDWARAKERYLTDGIARIAAMLRERGLDRVPISHNTPGVYTAPYDHVAIERAIDVQGIDFYVRPSDYERLRRGCLYMAGTSRLPYIPEFGAGTWPWWRPVDDADTEFNALAALMHGVKGFNYYMLVERDRWLGSPIGADGDVRPVAGRYRRLLALLERLDWPALRRRCDVLVLQVRDYERHAFASRAVSPPFLAAMLGPLGPLAGGEIVAERDLGLGCVVPIERRRWHNGVLDALSRAHVPFALGDSESETDHLLRHPAIVAPGFAYMSRATQERLRDYAGRGGTLVIGPELPRLDDLMAPCDELAGDLPGLTLVRRPEQVVAALEAAGIAVPWQLDNPAIDIAVHEDGARRVVFLANPTEQVECGRLVLGGAQGFEPVWGEPATASGDGALAVRLEPREIQVFEARGC